MRGRSIWISMLLAIFASAAIAYGLVFWTPWFGASTGWYVDSWVDVGYYDTSTPSIRDLAALQPEHYQALVKRLFEELVKLPESELYMLSAAGDDVCVSPLIDCNGVPGRNVRPFVEKALAHKQSRETIAIAAGGLYASQLSLAVSIVALVVSAGGFVIAMLTYRRKKDA